MLLVACAAHLSQLVCHAQNTAKTPETIRLESGWEFQQSNADARQWLPATVPGDVHLDLLRNHQIPDPYYRDNEAKLQWIGDASWTYRTTITIAVKLLERQHIDLVFDGLDTSAKVFLNGTSVLTANNMFRQWRVDAKPYLHVGANELRVEFQPASKVMAALAAEDKTGEAAHIPQKSYLRKAAYEFGWDRSSSPAASGVPSTWKPGTACGSRTFT